MTGFLSIKFDISKAYDQIEWSYLEGVMRKMSFSNRWINLGMSCVSTITYSIVINGKQSNKIIPSRGIRQGDLLSPYPFLLFTEGFSSLLKKIA